MNQDHKKEIIKCVKEIEKLLGIEIYNKLTDLFWKLEMRINDLEESRDMWRSRYMQLKGELN